MIYIVCSGAKWDVVGEIACSAIQLKGVKVVANEERRRFQASTIRDAQDLINSLFSTAKIDVRIIEIAICKEEVVIGSPQVEDYEHELKTVDKREDIKQGARYLALATIATEARQVRTYTRFYLTSDGKVEIEECHDDEVTVVQPEEAQKPELWKGAIETAVHWAELIIRLVLSLLGHIQ